MYILVPIITAEMQTPKVKQDYAFSSISLYMKHVFSEGVKRVRTFFA